MSKEIKWIVNRLYIIKYATRYGFRCILSAHVQFALKEWAEKYNCKVINGDTIFARCKEEDFLMIKLTCPEAIDHVVA